jgi:Na+-transporting NADH:ubiquinone oxidoreductase subunit C
MILIASVFGAGVTGIHLVTRKTLARNKDLAFQRALVNVFGLADKVEKPDYAKIYHDRITREERRDPETGRAIPCYTVYASSAKKTPIAYGFEFTGRGFWAPITGVLALAKDKETTIGLTILEQQETPGLGGRVAEPEFTTQFRKGVEVDPPKNSDRFVRFASSAPSADAPGAKRYVDMITGATQTSLAMERILNDSLAAYYRALAAAAPEGGQPDETR